MNVKKSFIIILLLIFANQLFSADDQESSLNIQGSASISVTPTEIGINIRMESIEETYSQSIDNLVRRVKILNKNLENAGVNESERFTSGFDIRKNMVYEDNRQKLKGYLSSQIVLVRIKLDMNRLIKIINHITKSEAAPEISIAFSIDDATLAEKQKELIKLAVDDARSKAELIAQQSGLRIDGVKKIIYGLQQNYVGNRYDMLEAVKSKGYASGDMSAPTNIVLSDKIEIIYNISSKQ